MTGGCTTAPVESQIQPQSAGERPRLDRGMATKGSNVQDKLQREAEERRMWVAVITGFLTKAPQEATLVQEALTAKRSTQALEGLFF